MYKGKHDAEVLEITGISFLSVFGNIRFKRLVEYVVETCCGTGEEQWGLREASTWWV